MTKIRSVVQPKTRRKFGHRPFKQALIVGAIVGSPVQAHIIPVDFGSFDGTIGGTTTEKNNGDSGNYGWIDGTDVDWGDTHKLATYTFTLTGHAADVTLTIRGKANAFGGNGLAPGFSVYQGSPAYGANLDHDFATGSELIRTNVCAATPNCSTTEGSFRALTDFSVTTDADPTGSNPNVFTYVASAYDGASIGLPAANSPLQDGNTFVVPGADDSADKSVTLFLPHLATGNYIVFVGGTTYANQTSTANNAARGVGGILSVVPVAAVPVPGAAWLFGSALFGLLGLRRRPH
ncbi:hypothetical protein [Methylomonas sp. UP202]|uniref:hypothetical protein n=1 Tax=Methylomonas sp. UP202 TaxID=3040943 RepID=UPI0024798AC8|nr:hypothetical protein [Methylomonas sp. UP202]WGS85760.1 hypothetical protein QC632_22420 [Methylomonas sp. UP202]